ncbi:MAG: cytochrome c peroxidase [Candidatus Eisenbacteria bacterium]
MTAVHESSLWRPLAFGIATALAVVSTGCADLDSETNPLTPDRNATDLPWNATSILDELLGEQLIEVAPGGHLTYFMMPSAEQLSQIPQDPQNPLTPEKVELGRLLYHETCLGVDNVRDEGYETYSCSSCHFAQAGFQANRPQGISEGGVGFGAAGEGREFNPDYLVGPEFPDVQPIRTPSSMNAAYQELMLWNGQFGGVGDNLGTEEYWQEGTPLESNRLGLHGLETQAHAGLAVHRMGDIDLSRIMELPEYMERFAAAFPGDPEPVNRYNAAMAIAAFERTLLANRSPFQLWLKGDLRALRPREKRGAILFFGDAKCYLCHTGPALSSMTFHALGMNDLDGTFDPSRVFLGASGGTVPNDVRQGRGGFTRQSEDMFKFKTPQLYNLLDSPFYGHGSSFGSVRAVVEYKNAGMPENGLVPSGQIAEEFHPLGLTDEQIDDLVAFLEGGLYDADLMRYAPLEILSGNCFPNNDPQSRHDLGCDPLPLPLPDDTRHLADAGDGMRH